MAAQNWSAVQNYEYPCSFQILFPDFYLDMKKSIDEQRWPVEIHLIVGLQ